jgi:hypothetical protein
MKLPPAPAELMPKILWWDCGCGFDCVCGAKDFFLSDESAVTCDQCGREWELRTKLWCTVPSNNGFHADRAGGSDRGTAG